ncbi:MAG: metal-sulfur cluster assembly factor [Anaerolineae bacterium]|nr:metal-sulfur cluster assembly factor [Anaerolineae bacterium]
MPTEEEIHEVLRPVIDPEIGLSVVDLGMIRQVQVDEAGRVEIGMVLTAPFCPLAGFLAEQVRQAAAAVPGVSAVEVRVLDEPWDPAWMARPGGM